MTAKKLTHAQVRHECIVLALGKWMLSDYDDANCHIKLKTYENLCRKYEKNHAFDISIVMTLETLADDKGQTDRSVINPVLNECLDMVRDNAPVKKDN